MIHDRRRRVVCSRNRKIPPADSRGFSADAARLPRRAPEPRPRGGRSEPRYTTRRSPRRILPAFVCVHVHLCLRENACFSRVTWPLRLAHKGQKRGGHCCRGVSIATAYAKESPVEGSLWHGTPWGTGALVPWTKHLPESPPSVALPSQRAAFRPAALYPALFYAFSFPAARVSPRFSPRFLTAGSLENGKQSERASHSQPGVCTRCNLRGDAYRLMLAGKERRGQRCRSD